MIRCLITHSVLAVHEESGLCVRVPWCLIIFYDLTTSALSASYLSAISLYDVALSTSGFTTGQPYLQLNAVPISSLSAEHTEDRKL